MLKILPREVPKICNEFGALLRNDSIESLNKIRQREYDLKWHSFFMGELNKVLTKEQFMAKLEEWANMSGGGELCVEIIDDDNKRVAIVPPLRPTIIPDVETDFSSIGNQSNDLINKHNSTINDEDRLDQTIANKKISTNKSKLNEAWNNFCKTYVPGQSVSKEVSVKDVKSYNETKSNIPIDGEL